VFIFRQEYLFSHDRKKNFQTLLQDCFSILQLLHFAEPVYCDARNIFRVRKHIQGNTLTQNGKQFNLFAYIVICDCNHPCPFAQTNVCQFIVMRKFMQCKIVLLRRQTCANLLSCANACNSKWFANF
jgi:hypothetical protein